MAELRTTTLTAISLAFIISFSLASALDFTLTSPESAEINSSFSVSLSAQVSESHDVKIFVQDNVTKSTISEIYNDGWKNPFYYLKSAFPSKLEFEIRIISNSDNAVLCARLRKTNSSTYSERCSPIKITSSQQDEEDEEKVEIRTEVNLSETKKEEPIKEAAQDFSPPSYPAVNETVVQETGPERIILNNADRDINQDSIFVTKQEKIKLFALYGFTILSVFIIIVLSLRRL